jgi:SAM-dependent methyltransferase
MALARPGLAGPPGRALMLADGDGRNGSWLAARGWRVTAVDLSPEATRRAVARDGAAGVAAERIVADLAHWSPPAEARFALAAILFLQVPEGLRARAVAVAAGALAPGGHLLVEAFAGARDPGAPLGPEAPVRWNLAALLARLAVLPRPPVILEALEGTVLMDDGPRHAGHGRILRLLARAPG